MAISRSWPRPAVRAHRRRARLLGVHQHGYAHTQPRGWAGAASSAAPQRARAAQRSAAGPRALQSLFGHRLDDIFTPPWNRCAAYTPGLLAELGFAALSRDRTAPAQQDLPELGVDVDWCKHSGWRRLQCVGPGAARWPMPCAAASTAQPLGLMLHHAQMSGCRPGAAGPLAARAACPPQVALAVDARGPGRTRLHAAVRPRSMKSAPCASSAAWAALQLGPVPGSGPGSHGPMPSTARPAVWTTAGPASLTACGWAAHRWT
jgi:hypothetical protein